MTEESYQQGRKVMQKANYWRGVITVAKGNVSKWTKIEMAYREQLRDAKANAAHNMLQKSLLRLNEVRKRFEDIKFPDNNLESENTQRIQCENCGDLIIGHSGYCNNCRN